MLIRSTAFLFGLLATSIFSPASQACEGQGCPAVTPAPVNIYSEIGSDKLSPAVAGALQRVYVPNHSSNTVSVIDPATHKVIDTYKVGLGPQHIVPSWDLKTLWVANTANFTEHGSMTPIDPLTGKPGKEIPVNDPYNVYFTPDGTEAIIVAEAHRQLEFRDPHTMVLPGHSLDETTRT